MREASFLHTRVNDLIQMHDEVVWRKWLNDKAMELYACKTPFTTIRLQQGGEVYTCCGMFLKQNHFLGNAYTESFESIWNSDKAKILRYSVTEGDFEYCNDYCGALAQYRIHSKREVFPNSCIVERSSLDNRYKRWQDCTVSSTPKKIIIECIEACNLACFTCRSRVKVESCEQNDKIFNMLMNFVRPALKNCEVLQGVNSGELFASKAAMKFYKTLSKEEFPMLKLEIMTNGQLITKKRMDEFSNLKGMISEIRVSVDADEKETYESIRRGGSWEKLCNNMDFIKSMKENGEIEKIQVSFVVQKRNYLQMENFVKLAKKWGADQIAFQRFMNIGATGLAEYEENDVLNPKSVCYLEAKKIVSNVLAMKNNENDIRITGNVF